MSRVLLAQALRNLEEAARQVQAGEMPAQSINIERMAARDALAAADEPIDMVLHCPACGLQHIDAPWKPGDFLHNDQITGVEPVWTNPPHRSHLCAGCGHVWRPADVATNGVEAIKTAGKNDSPEAAPKLPDILFDGHTVLQHLAPHARGRTSPENVSDALDAVVRAMRDSGVAAPAQIGGTSLSEADCFLIEAALQDGFLPHDDDGDNGRFLCNGVQIVAFARRFLAHTVPTSELAKLLPGPYYMDPPDGGDVTVLEQLRRMSEDAAKWRASQSGAPIKLSVIRQWPDGFADRLEHVWKDLIGFIPNFKLYDLQRVLAEFGFVMTVHEGPCGKFADDAPGSRAAIKGLEPNTVVRALESMPGYPAPPLVLFNRDGSPIGTPQRTVDDLQRELLAICKGGSFADEWRKLNAPTEWPSMRDEFGKLARVRELRKQIQALNPNAALYYGWAGHGDEKGPV